jgi:hypothetical protein
LKTGSASTPAYCSNWERIESEERGLAAWWDDLHLAATGKELKEASCDQDVHRRVHVRVHYSSNLERIESRARGLIDVRCRKAATGKELNGMGSSSKRHSSFSTVAQQLGEKIKESGRWRDTSHRRAGGEP